MNDTPAPDSARAGAFADHAVEWAYRVFLDAADPIVIEDLQGVVLDMNPEAVRSYGFPKEDLVGKPITTIVPPRRHHQAHELLSRCLEGEQLRNVEGIRQTRDGREVPVLITLSLLRSEDGTPVGVATIAKDIGTLKVVEEENRRLTRVFMDATDPIIVEDLHGVVIDLNREAEQTYGFSREELLGSSIKRLVPPSRHEQADDLLARCLAGERVRNVEGLRWNRSQEILPILVTLSALKDEAGETVAVATMVKDISHLKAVEDENRRLARVYMDVSVPIIVEDLDGIVMDLNQAAVDTYGFPRDELIGQPITTLVPPERHVQAEELLERCLSGESMHNVEGLRWTRAHEIVPVLLTLSVLRNEEGEPTAIATIAKDITELKAVEAELKSERESLERRVTERTRELTKARADMEELATGLSKYLSPSIYASLFEGSREARVGSQRKWLTVFFSDLVGFTEVSERLLPEEMTSLLNEYLTEMTDIVFKYGGTLDKYIGDAILVFFGDPDSRGQEEDALAAVQMALEMQDRLRVLRSEWAARGIAHQFRVRVGITSGHCTVGNFGSDRLLSYTIMGRHVNLASRLETAADPDEILVSKPTWSLVSDRVRVVEREAVHAKGFDKPIEAFQIVGLLDAKQSAGVIQRTAPGFSLWLDPEKASDGEGRAEVLRHLQRALRSLEQQQ